MLVTNPQQSRSISLLNHPRYIFPLIMLWMMLFTSIYLLNTKPLYAAPQSQPISNINDAKKAIIQIATVGTYVDPSEILPFTSSGRGSGFIIDPSGLAMTNNHIVTGASYINVWIDGEDEPRNARVVAVSECADLALIDIAGDGFPYLEWSSNTLAVGAGVYAGGFPGGERAYELTTGAITSMARNGATHWASLDSVIGHNASIAPGSSGGPLMDQYGRVMAVNYAGQADESEYLAIAQDLVQPLLPQLRAGQDVDAIGINGLAVEVGQINPLTGIWVSSIELGSIAQRVGVMPGDIVISLDNILLAADGSMADYCQILRSHSLDDVINIRVLRRANRQILAGQLNGNPLRSTLPLFNNVIDQQILDTREQLTQGMIIEPISTAQIQAKIGGVSLERNYVNVQSSAVTAVLPAAWLDIASDTWTLGNDWLGLKFQSSTDLIKMTDDSWTASGIIIYNSAVMAQRMNPDEFLTDLDLSRKCGTRERFSHAHTIEGRTYRGAYDHWRDCDTPNAELIIFVVVDDDRELLYLVEFYILEEKDMEAFEVFRKTFHFAGSAYPQPIIAPVRPGPVTATPYPTPVPTPLFTGPSTTLDVQAQAGAMAIEMPGLWGTIESGAWVVDNQVAGYQIAARPSVDSGPAQDSLVEVTYRLALDTSNTPKSTVFLDLHKYYDRCTTINRKGFRNDNHRGAYDYWTDCDDGLIYVVAASEPIEDAPYSYMLTIFATINDLAGIDQLKIMLTTMEYNIGTNASSDPIVSERPPARASNVAQPSPSQPSTSQPATPSESAGGIATVIVTGLNVRNGPGLNYERIGRATLSQQLRVRAQYNNCAWLQVVAADGSTAWVSGDPNYVTLDVACSSL